MDFYWVNLGRTYKDAVEHGFLWAPKTKIKVETGKVYSHIGWQPVGQLKKNDVVFCYDHGYIKEVAVASEDAYRAMPPVLSSFSDWPEEGHRVEVSFHHLSRPVPVEEVALEFSERYNDLCSTKVFTNELKVSQFYMARIPNAGALLLLGQLGDEILSLEGFDSNNQSTKRLTKKAQTAKEAIVQARVGQGQFRKEVLAYWDTKCPFSGVSDCRLLTASHIYPWALSSNEEKLDHMNGLPLMPSLDKLFDKGYISFNDRGEIIKNVNVDDGLLTSLGVDPNGTPDGPTQEHLVYLSKHRKLFKFPTEAGL